jgi:hypothetical protein
MSIVGWLQIAVFAATIGLLTRPLGGYLARVYGGERTLLRLLLDPLEQALYRFAGIHIFLARLPRTGNRSALCIPAAAICLAAQSAKPAERLTRSDAQYRGKLRHQHELAVVRGRDDAELFEPNGRHHRSVDS